MPTQQRIIGARYRYIGDWHPGLHGHEVEIVQVLRGPSPDEYMILRNDEEIGGLEPDDIVEFAPLVREADGRTRRSFVTSDARASHLERVDG